LPSVRWVWSHLWSFRVEKSSLGIRVTPRYAALYDVDRKKSGRDGSSAANVFTEPYVNSTSMLRSPP